MAFNIVDDLQEGVAGTCAVVLIVVRAGGRPGPRTLAFGAGLLLQPLDELFSLLVHEEA